MLRAILLLLLCQQLNAQVDTLKLQVINWDKKLESGTFAPIYADKATSAKNTAYFKLEDDWIYPGFLSSGSYNFEKTYYDRITDTLVLRLRYTIDKQLEVCVDQNKDGSFSDEIVHLTAFDKEVILPFHLRWKDKSTGQIYTLARNHTFKVAWDAEQEANFIQGLKTGGGYRVKEGLPEGMTAHIAASSLSPPLYLYDSLGNQLQSKTASSYNKAFRLFEPFQIGGKWYYLGPINEPRQEIYLHQLSEDEKPYGPAVGHYVDLALLEKNTTQPLFQQWDTVQQPYALVHFWGPWCGHCLVEKEEVAELAKQLKSSPIHWVEVACILPSKKRTASMQEVQVREQVAGIDVFQNQNIVNMTSTELHSGGFNTFTHVKALFEQFANTAYPGYYLISKTGEIILVHAGRMEDKLLPKLEPYLGE